MLLRVSIYLFFRFLIENQNKKRILSILLILDEKNEQTETQKLLQNFTNLVVRY